MSSREVPSCSRENALEGRFDNFILRSPRPPVRAKYSAVLGLAANPALSNNVAPKPYPPRNAMLPSRKWTSGNAFGPGACFTPALDDRTPIVIVVSRHDDNRHVRRDVFAQVGHRRGRPVIADVPRAKAYVRLGYGKRLLRAAKLRMKVRENPGSHSDPP